MSWHGWGGGMGTDTGTEGIGDTGTVSKFKTGTAKMRIKSVR